MHLLEVRDLVAHFEVQDGWVHAVDDVSVTLDEGRTLGLVGESGCGKTTLGYAVTQLLPSNAVIKQGSVFFSGKDLLAVTRMKNGRLREYHPEITKIRWAQISMIFQGAMNAFNPVYRVGDQIIEAIRIHEDADYSSARKRVEHLYSFIGIPPDRIDHYPHEYSGGMRQRAMIAMALALNPKFIIADEPTTALDVIMQRRILREMQRLQEEFKMAMIIISHDVSTVAEAADDIAVMYAGKIMEIGTAREIFKETANPYTEALLSAFPSIKGPKRRLLTIPGNPPSLLHPPSGCRFHPRCRYAREICASEPPNFVEIAPGHRSLCHFAREMHEGLLGVR
ncbi:MAG: ABC transporter ATP-binding protein [Candidatus Thermoplasmatota archaeon]